MTPSLLSRPRLRRPAARAVLAAAALGSLPLATFAAPPPGRLLASQCAQCHGTNGQAVGGFESISGKNANEMFHELVEMKNRPVESIMDRQARGYTDAQLRLIANYLAQLPAGSDDERQMDGTNAGDPEAEDALTNDEHAAVEQLLDDQDKDERDEEAAELDDEGDDSDEDTSDEDSEDEEDEDEQDDKESEDDDNESHD